MGRLVRFHSAAGRRCYGMLPIRFWEWLKKGRNARRSLVNAPLGGRRARASGVSAAQAPGVGSTVGFARLAGKISGFKVTHQRAPRAARTHRSAAPPPARAMFFLKEHTYRVIP